MPFFLAAGISLLTKFALNFVSSVLIWLHGVLSPEINTSKEGSHEKAQIYYCSADPCGHCAVRLLSGNALAARSEHSKSEFGIDLKSESVTVERLAYTYDDGNIFGEGFAAYKIGFTQDASAHFAGLDTTPDADADDGIELARENGVELPAVPDGTPFAYKSENQGLNRVFLLYYSTENTAYLITLDA